MKKTSTSLRNKTMNDQVDEVFTMAKKGIIVALALGVAALLFVGFVTIAALVHIGVLVV